MNKRILPLLLLAAAPALSFGQSTLTASNFNPVSTDAYLIKICNTTGVTPGAAGSAVTWNFGTLTATTTDTGKAINCPTTDPTAHCALFPASNIALKGPGLYRQTIYYNATSTSLSQNGYYSSADTNMIFTDPAKQFTYPFTMGTTFSDTYAGIINMNALSGHINGTLNVTCDAYGTLNLPGRTDTGVLRVHTTQTFIDSVDVFGSPSGTVLTYTIETYSWYKANYHAALLTIATSTIMGSPTPFNTFVAYAPAQLTEVANVPDEFATVNVYPNPTQDVLNIDLDSKATEATNISLLDITGRQVALIANKQMNGSQHFSYNTTGLAKGLYLVRIQSGASSTTKKVTIQ